MAATEPEVAASPDMRQASPVWVYPGLRKAKVGAAFWDRLGYATPPEPTGWGEWKEFVHRNDQRALVRLLCAMRRHTCADARLDLRFRAAAGRWMWTRLLIQRCEIRQSAAPLYAGMLLDIGHEKELERRCQALFERPFQFVGLMTRDGDLIETNTASLQVTGYTAAEVLGRKFWDAPFFSGQTQTRELLQAGVAHACLGEVVRFEMTSPSRDGGLISTDFTLTPLFDDEGLVTFIIPEGRDITAMVQAREALRVAENRFTIATRSANIGVWDWNPQTDTAWFNDQFFLMLGYQPGDAPYRGSTLVELAHPEDQARVEAVMRSLPDSGKLEHSLEYRMRCKDGGWRWVLTLGRVVEHSTDGRASRVAGVHLDVTERKELETQLASAQRLESIGQLAAGLAHEINTPIQFVRDSFFFIEEAVRAMLQSNDAEQASDMDAMDYFREQLPAAIERAHDGLSRVTAIVQSMREFSHADNMEMAPVDLNRAIEATLVVARHEYRQVADARCELDDIPQVVCYGSQINQVLLNLVVNAAHAIRDVVERNGKRGCITISTRRDGDCVVIDVADTGTGIPENIRHRLFEPFFTTKSVGKGTGQGLAMARSIIVKRHHGELSFSTECGVGTTFHVRLPIDGDNVMTEMAVA